MEQEGIRRHGCDDCLYRWGCRSLKKEEGYCRMWWNIERRYDSQGADALSEKSDKAGEERLNKQGDGREIR